MNAAKQVLFGSLGLLVLTGCAQDKKEIETLKEQNAALSKQMADIESQKADTAAKCETQLAAERARFAEAEKKLAACMKELAEAKAARTVEPKDPAKSDATELKKFQEAQIKKEEKKEKE